MEEAQIPGTGEPNRCAIISLPVPKSLQNTGNCGVENSDGYEADRKNLA